MNKITFKDKNGRRVLFNLKDGDTLSTQSLLDKGIEIKRKAPEAQHNLSDNEQITPPAAEREKPNTSFSLDAGTLELLKQNYQELHHNGGLASLYNNNPQVYAYVFNRTFGKYPSNVDVDMQKQDAIRASLVMGQNNLSYTLDKKTLDLMLEDYDTLFQRGDLQMLLDEKPQVFAFVHHNKFRRYPASVVPDMYIQDGLATEYKKALIAVISDMSFDELYKSDKLELLRTYAPHVYERKLKEKR